MQAIAPPAYLSVPAVAAEFVSRWKTRMRK
jgi:hypothetical protein